MVSQPIIREIKDNEIALAEFENNLLPGEDEKVQDVIMNFPTVYIHNWPETGNMKFMLVNRIIYLTERESIIIIELKMKNGNISY